MVGGIVRGIALAAAVAALAGPARADDWQQRTTIAAVERMAPAYGLDPALVTAIIRAESDFDPLAVSPKNARGLMQLMPETALRFGVANVFDPAQNLRGGMSYLRWLLDRFGGDLALSLAAYNAGENAVAMYGGVPPFPETQAYVARVQQLYGSHGRMASAHVAHGAARRPPSIERTRSGVVIYRGIGPS